MSVSRIATHRLAADLALLLVTAIWGSTFVLVKDAVAHYPVLPFLALRFAVAAVALAPAAWWARGRLRASDIAAGAAAGALLFAGYALQTFGLQETTASKAGFITGLSVVLVPLFVALLWRRLPTRTALAGTALATAGLALLSLNADWSMQRGDLLVLGCAFGFAGHITALGALSPGRDARLLTLVQVATVALLSGGASLGAGGFPAVPGAVWGAALFTGLAATALAFFIQTAAQKFTTAGHTALIFAAEPVFAALFGVLVAGERLAVRGWLGSAVILAGVILGALAQADAPARPGRPAPPPARSCPRLCRRGWR
ncbi:MAG TPA: DMT family transporter [Anaerolineae bacterium]|nr:DMT family transporter [Anaerolineae bacterium]